MNSHATARIFAVNISILLALALVAELIFGQWVFGSKYGTLNLPRNLVDYFDTSGLYPGGGQIRYSRDEHGFRGPYGDVSSIDILTVGGSTTNQLYLDDNATWQATMRRLSEAAGSPLTVVNAAVDGQSTRGNIAIFEHWFPNVPKLRSKFVLAYVGINDTALDADSQFDEMQSPELSRRLRHWVMNKSAIYNLFRTARGVFKAYNAKLVHGTPSFDGKRWHKLRPALPRPTPGAHLLGNLNAYRARLLTLVSRIRDFGADPILVTQPTAAYRIRDGWVWVTQNDKGELNAATYINMAAFNQVTMAVCRKVNAICVDLAISISFKDGDFYDHVHNTPEGAAKVGRFLFERLKAHI